VKRKRLVCSAKEGAAAGFAASDLGQESALEPMAVASGFASTPSIVKARGRMIRIDIIAAAFEAILPTMPLGSAAYEAERTASGEVRIRLAEDVVNKLRAMRGRARATATSFCGWRPMLSRANA
jgi:hypothetical protein